MNALKFFAFLLVAVFCGVQAELKRVPEVRISDPWGPAREECRKECGLTQADLLKAENNLRSVKTFLLCVGKRLGKVNGDGSINREVLLKKVSPMTPITIARPILDCCMDRVYKGQCPRDQNETAILFADLVTCWKDLLPKSMWRIIGSLAPPTYPRLDKCDRRRW